MLSLQSLLSILSDAEKIQLLEELAQSLQKDKLLGVEDCSHIGYMSRKAHTKLICSYPIPSNKVLDLAKDQTVQAILAYCKEVSDRDINVREAKEVIQYWKGRRVAEDDDIYLIEEFKQACESGNFIDYDGHGEYSDGRVKSGITVYPSDYQDLNKGWTHVVWYNK